MLIRGKNITYTYKEAQNPSLNGVDFEIEKGRCHSFLGKSGSGKTTLLKCMAGLYSNYGGSLERYENVRSGFVSQNFSLFSNMTVLGNCMHPQIHVLKRSAPEARIRAEEILEALDIGLLGDRTPKKLSGGQRQRVAIAQALCMDAEVLLFDEPTSALDPHTTKQFQDLLSGLLNKGITLVITTHDMPFVRSLLDKVYFMESGEIIERFDVQQGGLSSRLKDYIYGEAL